jgi:hypothetical protein
MLKMRDSRSRHVLPFSAAKDSAMIGVSRGSILGTTACVAHMSVGPPKRVAVQYWIATRRKRRGAAMIGGRAWVCPMWSMANANGYSAHGSKSPTTSLFGTHQTLPGSRYFATASPMYQAMSVSKAPRSFVSFRHRSHRILPLGWRALPLILKALSHVSSPAPTR